MSNNPIVLKSNRLSDECIGTVRLTPEAERSEEHTSELQSRE